MSLSATLVLINEAAANVTFTPSNSQPGVFQEYRDRSGSVLAAQDTCRISVKQNGKRYETSVSIKVFYPVVVGSATVYKYCHHNGSFAGSIVPSDAPLNIRQRFYAYIKSAYAHAAVKDSVELLDPPRTA